MNLRAWNALFVAAVLIAFLALVYSFFDSNRGQISAKPLVKKAALRETEADKRLDAHTWKEDPQALGPAVLKQMVELADRHHLKLADFRADSSLQFPNLKEMPFVLTLEGGFSDLMAFVNSLEGEQSKLALNLLEVTSADPSSRKVSANLGLIGFMKMGGH